MFSINVQTLCGAENAREHHAAALGAIERIAVTV
jgi:hypothetical protein